MVADVALCTHQKINDSVIASDLFCIVTQSGPTGSETMFRWSHTHRMPITLLHPTMGRAEGCGLEWQPG